MTSHFSEILAGLSQSDYWVARHFLGNDFKAVAAPPPLAKPDAFFPFILPGCQY